VWRRLVLLPNVVSQKKPSVLFQSVTTIWNINGLTYPLHAQFPTVHVCCCPLFPRVRWGVRKYEASIACIRTSRTPIAASSTGTKVGRRRRRRLGMGGPCYSWSAHDYWCTDYVGRYGTNVLTYPYDVVCNIILRTFSKNLDWISVRATVSYWFASGIRYSRTTS